MLKAYPYYASTEKKLVGDFYNYRVISRYATNSGTAIGCNFEEAAIHAINELIERDALSLFLLRVFIKSSPDAISLLDHSSFPEEINTVIKKTEAEIGEEVLIIDLTTDIGVPTFCSILKNPREGVQPFGCGTSLFKTLAVERSLYELLQKCQIQDKDMFKEDIAVLKSFSLFPKLYECAAFNVHRLIDANQFKFVLYQDIRGFDISTNLKTYLKTLMLHLKLKGFETFYSYNYKSTSNICIVNIFIPGLERFNIVMSGNIVTPSIRGKYVMNVSR